MWTSTFWTTLCRDLGIHQQLATARHQQTDGQAERAIGVVKAMLRAHLGTSKKDWIRVLPLLEFAHNATPHTTTGHSPHQMALGTNLRGFDGVRLQGTLADLPTVLEQAKAALAKAQERQARAYNAKRKQVGFAAGDFVLVHREAIAQAPDLAAKYRAPYIGPYRIIEVKPNDNYRLELPTHLRIHPEFHVSALRQYFAPDEGRTIARPGPVAGDREFEVERILAQRIRRGQRQFLVLWKGYDQAEATWEREANLANAQAALDEFRKGPR